MQSEQQVWVLDDDSSIRWVLERALQRAGLQSRSFADAASLYAALQHQQPLVLLTDIRMPGDDGLAVLDYMRQHHPQLRVIVMTAHSDLDSAVSAFQGGAFEYLAKPFDLDEVVHTVGRALQLEQREQAGAAQDSSLSGLIGAAPAMQDVFRAIGRLSHSSATVLITGASGTGKELVARALHQHSPRQSKPFIALNMAAIPADLIESELFGHEKGAFTGAMQRRRGRFEQADGGTLFLDEIGDMPLAVQTRLLRVLAEGQFYPVGSYEPVRVNVRIIAATHQNLEARVRDHAFREDLFHRLNVIRLQLPTLAERRSDIPQLARHFLQKAAHELNAEPKQLTAAAEAKLQSLPWPGNVRQLENMCRWLTVMAPARQVDVTDLPAASEGATTLTETGDWQSALRSYLEQQMAGEATQILTAVVQQVETLALEVALAATDGHKQQAAEKLGWGRNTITRKLKELVKEA
ncbi:nitrogen regulation protein NR(I) [Pseudidiomarina sediminum]|uniref:nitrogen regulation protein NR(I) n=1 Tax=Pseudidiomarina sediminum TaxID=431675 RepID=UPI001C97C570|nr:nitrogen regulation protein NR(I) [Pseudidiomarina sediminum]MBY6064530.1 nitrogen regulation protein NR(I) [Pseudidiomarina sediminum]